MKYLSISITFLEDRFNGQTSSGPEWPPSPWRLFQAMIAAASNGTENMEVLFKWLETLEPPVIISPEVIKTKRAVNYYVPNNSSDVKTGENTDRTLKRSRSSIFPGDDRTIIFLWPFSDGYRGEAERIQKIIPRINCLGWGIDLVAGCCRIIDEYEAETFQEKTNLRVLIPSLKNISSSTVLRVPCSGSFLNLKAVHDTKMHRFEGNVYRPSIKPSIFREVPYLPKGTKNRDYCAFRLVDQDIDSDHTLSFDQRYACHISSWVRGFLCNAAQFSSDIKQVSELYVAGHVDATMSNNMPRLSYLPIPSVGHKYADGNIRRLIVAEPFGQDQNLLKWAEQVMHNGVLKDKTGPIARVERITATGDKVLRHYISPATLFKTVTPVILPGFDSRKYEKAERLLKKSIVQAGFSMDDITDLYLQKAPFYRSSFHPREYKRVKHLQNYSAFHVKIIFKQEISGPLSLGAGRFRGLGLFSTY